MSCPHRSSTRSISIDTQHAKGPAAVLRQVLVCVKYFVEFRPAGRNKMEIHVIRQLRRPDRTSVSGFTAYGCRVLLAGKHTAHLASVEFCASGAKLCAQSRRRPFCQESVSFFDSITGMRSGASRLFFVQQEIGKASCRIAECVAVFPRQRHAALRCVVQRHQCHLLFKSTRHALIEHRDSQSQLDHG